MTCFCPPCNRATDKQWCWPCWASLRDHGECPHGFICDLPPCDQFKVWISKDYRVTHYAELGHSDPDEDDERFLRKLGLRRHPDALSPLDSFDAS
jgi:hypothetical protein